MTLLAVAARPVAVEEAAFELEWPTDRVDSAANELVGRGVIVRSVSTLVVTHDLVRSAVEQEVPAASARAMHARIVRYLEHQRSDDPRVLTETLAHRRAGGLALGGLALALARSPRRRLLGLDVLRQLETIADEADPDDGGATLNTAIASLAAELQQHEAALRRFAVRVRTAGGRGVEGRRGGAGGIARRVRVESSRGKPAMARGGKKIALKGCAVQDRTRRTGGPPASVGGARPGAVA